mgnify:FL=1
MSVTIKDIANVAGVSYSTVSKALNNSPLVKEKTKRRITQIAEEMGYEPNFAAQRLVSKNSKVIGLIWPTIERTVLAALVTNINKIIADTPYSMILSVDSIQKSMDTFKKFQVDGIILFEENINVEVAQNQIPIISYAVSKIRDYPYPVIDANHEQAMFYAVDYLYKLGHRKITYIGNISPIDPRQMVKFEGFQNAMKHYQLPFDHDNVIDTKGLDWYDGYSAMNKLVRQKNMPSAIVGGSYDISAGIIRGLKENNINIPKNISVISYDNIPQMANLEVPLTCIGVEIDELATEIVSTIIKMVEEEKVEIPIKKMTPTLIERSSCAYVKQ